MRTGILLISVVVSLAAVLGPALPVRAGDIDAVIRAPRPTERYYRNPEYRKDSRRRRDIQGLRMDTLRRALQAKPEPLWSDTEVNEYLESICWYVNYCFNHARSAQQVRDDNLPVDMARLNSLLWIPILPLNPFRNWEPVKIVALSDGFSAGDVFIETPPPELWDNLTDPGFTQACGIYGRDPGWKSRYPEAGFIQPNGTGSLTYNWLKVPPGTAFLLSTGSQTTAKSEYQIAHDYG